MALRECAHAALYTPGVNAPKRKSAPGVPHRKFRVGTLTPREAFFI
jgi:hypothetical protein